jgi:branched-chain amino acid transport system ATP-binding protein
MLKVEKLSVYYGHHRALENVSLEVNRGEVVVVLGANGAGKSTLLKAISGLVGANANTDVNIDGTPIQHAKLHQIVEAGIALVPEGRGVFASLTVEENLKLGAYAKRARKNENRNRKIVTSLFPLLLDRYNQIVGTMSGGEQQMVAIGRSLMSQPSILMLDEPSLGLSPLLTTEVFKTLALIRETGTGVLLVEQNAKKSLAVADRGYLLENGHIGRSGLAKDLVSDESVRKAYLGG